MRHVDFKRRLRVTLTLQAEIDSDDVLYRAIAVALMRDAHERAIQGGVGESGSEYVYQVGEITVNVRHEFENQYWENGVRLPLA